VRNLFLLLLLANLLLPAWYRWALPPPVPMPAALPGELELLAAPSLPVPVSAADQRCLQLGPFASDAAAGAAARVLRAEGLELREILRPGEQWLGNWVQVEGFASLEAAEAARRQLVAGGLSDAYIMQVDESHRISLGVFRERERADAVLRQARALGFDPALTDRTRPAQERWLELRLGPGQRFDAGMLGLPAARILRAEEVPCASAPAPDPPPGDMASDAEAGAQ